MDDRRLLNTELFDPAVAVERIAAEFRAGFDAIDILKVDVPLWKKEVYEGGEEWIGRGS